MRSGTRVRRHVLADAGVRIRARRAAAATAAEPAEPAAAGAFSTGDWLK